MRVLAFSALFVSIACLGCSSSDQALEEFLLGLEQNARPQVIKSLCTRQVYETLAESESIVRGLKDPWIRRDVSLVSNPKGDRTHYEVNFIGPALNFHRSGHVETTILVRYKVEVSHNLLGKAKVSKWEYLTTLWRPEDNLPQHLLDLIQSPDRLEAFNIHDPKNPFRPPLVTSSQDTIQGYHLWERGVTSNEELEQQLRSALFKKVELPYTIPDCFWSAALAFRFTKDNEEATVLVDLSCSSATLSDGVQHYNGPYGIQDRLLTKAAIAFFPDDRTLDRFRRD